MAELLRRDIQVRPNLLIVQHNVTCARGSGIRVVPNQESRLHPSSEYLFLQFLSHLIYVLIHIIIVCR